MSHQQCRLEKTDADIWRKKEQFEISIVCSPGWAGRALVHSPPPLHHPPMPPAAATATRRDGRSHSFAINKRQSVYQKIKGVTKQTR